MIALSPKQAIGLAFRLGLLEGHRLRDLRNTYCSAKLSMDEFRHLVLRDQLLTEYQLEKLCNGNRQGLLLGDYKVLRLISSSGYSRILQAQHLGTGEIVALKVLRDEYSKDREEVSRFIAEGELGMKLRHENIVSIYETVFKRNVHFLRMEYVEGWNLEEMLKTRGRLGPPEAIALMSHVARGLSYAFQHGITHRDICKSNILVNSRGIAKLIEFGLVRDPKPGTAEIQNPRSVEYQALEKTTEVERGDKQSDIYFCGCLLYQMLSGKDPLGEPISGERIMIRSRYRGVIQLRYFAKDLPHPVSLLVDRAMQLDVRKRFQTPHHLLTALDIVSRRLETAASEAASSRVNNCEEHGHRDDPKSSVLIVTADEGMRAMLRKHVGQLGHQILFTDQPTSALAMLKRNPELVDCVIFSTKEIGYPALRAFNGIRMMPWTKDLPAMLMLGHRQRNWLASAKSSRSRIVVQAPLTAREFVGKLNTLLPVASVILSSRPQTSDSPSGIGI